MVDKDNIDIASKYYSELNSKYSNYSKQGSDSGKNNRNSILNIKREQSQNRKESE